MRRLIILLIFLFASTLAYGQTFTLMQDGVIQWEYTCSSTSTPIPTCVYNYSDWTPSICPSWGVQTRTVISSIPPGCIGTPILSRSCAYIPPQPPVQGQLLAWNVNHVVFNFMPSETKTFIIRVEKNQAEVYAKAFQVVYSTMGVTVTGSFKMPLKPDGNPYRTSVGKTEFTGLSASNEGAINLYVSAGGLVLDPYIYPGDFILTLTADDQGGWGYMSTSIYY